MLGSKTDKSGTQDRRLLAVTTPLRQECIEKYGEGKHMASLFVFPRGLVMCCRETTSDWRVNSLCHMSAEALGPLHLEKHGWIVIMMCGVRRRTPEQCTLH